MSIWFVPTPIAWALVLGGVLGLLLALRAIINAWDERHRAEMTVIVVVALAGLLIFLVWWLTASHTPLWIRHPAPALLAFTPILGAFTVLGLQSVWRTRRSDAAGSHVSEDLRRGIGAVAAVSFGVVMLAQVGLNLHDSFTPRAETLATQRAQAATLAEQAEASGDHDSARDGSAWLAADPWGSAVSIVLLTGAHIGLSDAPAMNDSLRVTRGECTTGTVVEATRDYALCTP